MADPNPTDPALADPRMEWRDPDRAKVSTRAQQKAREVKRDHQLAQIAEKREAIRKADREQMPDDLLILDTNPAQVVPGITAVSARSPYGTGSPHSYIRDLARVSWQEHRIAALGRDRVSDGDLFAVMNDPIEAVHARIAHVRGERRSLTTAATTGGDFALANAPVYLGSMYDTAARAAARMPGVTTLEPLPTSGITVRVPTFTATGPSTAQADLATVADPGEGSRAIDVPVVTITAQTTGSLQLLDRGGPTFDAAIAQELGRANATALDVQVLSGTGTGGQMTGILNTAGLTSTTWTTGSPTSAALRQKGWAAYRDVNASGGLEPDALVMHPRRLAMLAAATGSAPIVTGYDLPTAPTTCGSVPTNLGTGTNEDRILLFARESVVLLTNRPEISVVVDASLSATGGFRVIARQYAALAIRRPEAVGILAGTGLATPSL